MKEDNKEIATMERQAAETQDHISRLQEELSQLDRYTRLSSKAFVAIKSFHQMAKDRNDVSLI